MSNDTTTIPTDTIAGDLDALIDGYLACWNTTDATERAQLVARHWADGARMVDPLVDVTGHDELAGVFAHFHEAYPGCSFRRRGGHDTHHTLARWCWEMVDASGTVVLDGLDVALLADDGRLAYVAGFFSATIPA